MLTLSNQKAAGMPLPLFLVAMSTVWVGEVWGAWLPWEPKAEPDAPSDQKLHGPSDQMLHALHYIQTLVAKGKRQPSRLAAQEAGPKEGEEQQWLQAVLETLQDTEWQVGGAEGQRPNPNSKRPAPHSRRHKKYPQEEEEKGEGQQDVWGHSLKRTNENADEQQYTPQKLATLQSVFEELQSIYGSKGQHRRRSSPDYEEEKGEEERGEVEEESEEEDKREEEDQADRLRKIWEGPMGDEDEEDREEDEDYNELPIIKRTSQSEAEWAGQPDQLSSLVDYYVLKLLQQTEQEQKRGVEEEEEMIREEEEEKERGEEERAASLSMEQLLRLSEELGVSPEELLRLLHSASNPLPMQALPQRPLQRARTTTLMQALPQMPFQPARATTLTQTVAQTPLQPARTTMLTQAVAQTPLQLNSQPVSAPPILSHTQAHSRANSQPQTVSFLSSPHARPLEAPSLSLSTSTARILHLLGLAKPDSTADSDITAPPPHRSLNMAPQDTLVTLLERRAEDDLNDLGKLEVGLQEGRVAGDNLGELYDLAVPDDLGAGLQDDDDLVRMLLRAEEEERGLPPRSAGAEEEERGLPPSAAVAEEENRGFPPSAVGAEEEEGGLLPRAAGPEEDDWGDMRRVLQGYLSQAHRSVNMETGHTRPDPSEDLDYQGDHDLQSILGLFESEHQDSTEAAEMS